MIPVTKKEIRKRGAEKKGGGTQGVREKRERESRNWGIGTEWEGVGRGRVERG